MHFRQGVPTFTRFSLHYSIFKSDRRKLKRKSILILMLIIFAAGLNRPSNLAAAAAPGTLDTSFKGDGVVQVTVPGGSSSTLIALAVQPDGKIVGVGVTYISGTARFMVVRIDPDGNLDNSFGVNGIATTSFGPNGAVSYALVIQSSGKIVLAGYAAPVGPSRFALARYTSYGAIDSSFGPNGNGTVTTTVGSGATAFALAVQPTTGELIALGSAGPTLALARYTADGVLDTTFGSSGIVMTSIGNVYGLGNAMTVQNDGKILVTGLISSKFGLERFNVNGAVDSTFGTSGQVTTQIGVTTDYAGSVLVQSDGKIVVMGQLATLASFALARYTSLGVLDSSFGPYGNGTALTPFGFSEFANSALQADGKLLITTFNLVNETFTLLRYTADGLLDASFGVGGIVFTPIGSTFGVSYSVAVQSDGKILLGGVAGSSMVVVRYLGDSADLSLSMSSTASPVSTSGSLNYTIKVTNNGPSIASGIVVTDNLPSGVTFTSSSASQGSCGGSATVICNLGTLTVGAVAVINISVHPTAGGTITNQATVASNTFDPQTANDAASATSMVDAAAPTWASTSTLSASVLSTNGVLLSWTPAADDTSVSGYRLYQGSTLLTTLTGSTYTYAVTGLTQGTTYNFKVEAGDAANNWSTNGPTGTVTLPAPSLLAALLPWLILVAVVAGFGIAVVMTKPKKTP